MGVLPAFWPEPYQCAAVVTVNFDAESVERRTKPAGGLWGRYSYGRYGARVGIQRILQLFEIYNIRATFFIPALDAELYPDLMERIAAAGHEVAGHGYAHEDFSQLSVDEQRVILERSDAVFQQVFGYPPAGWRAPDGLMTRHTRAILIERGYLYDSSFCDDDLPYLVEDNLGRRLVEIPVFASASDRPYYQARRPPWVVASAWKQEFQAVYAEGGLFNLTVHPRGDYGSGRAVRLLALGAILQDLTDYPRVWLATCREIAEWVHNSGADGLVWPA
jgi:peptidoglycan/xylan/chitin deacetylase (PgdA/CDA1 family)